MTETPPWLRDLLENPGITDICINRPTEIYIDQGRGLESWNGGIPLENWDVRGWVLQQLSSVGKSWDARHPFSDATLHSGHRLHAVFPPVAADRLLLSLRRLPTPIIDESPESRWKASEEAFQLLKENVLKGESLLISGATGSGKTTLATDLLSCCDPHERILALEDTPELRPHHPHFLSLVSRPPNADGFGEITLRTLLKQTLRMRPTRIVLGECRGAEVLDLLQALNTGHSGALATLHANSPREALRRLELLCLLHSPGNLPLAAIRELIALGVTWIAQTVRVGPQRLIQDVWRIEGREGDTILMRRAIG